MKTIAKIINIFGGVKNLHASIENPPYMRLVIEDIGVGPRGYQAIRVTITSHRTAISAKT
jgi:hypothetical protein